MLGGHSILQVNNINLFLVNFEGLSCTNATSRVWHSITSRLNINSDLKATAKGEMYSLALIGKILKRHLKSIRERERRFRILCTAVFHRSAAELRKGREEHEGRVPYELFKGIICDRFFPGLDEQEITDVYLAWSDKTEEQATKHIIAFGARKSLVQDMNLSIAQLDEETSNRISIGALIGANCTHEHSRMRMDKQTDGHAFAPTGTPSLISNTNLQPITRILRVDPEVAVT